METLIAGAIFVFGTIIGSFLNVLLIRFNTGRTSLGRSGCMNCGAQLHWFNLVPILSFVFQKGACVSCGSRLSLQYPIVEFLTGVLFILSWLLTPSVFAALFTMGVSAVLLFIAVYDLYHTIIPNKAVYLLGTLALLQIFTVFFLVPLPTNDKLLFLLLQLAAGLSTSAPLFLIWLISKGKAMGFGDVKLALVLGWLLSIYGGLQALGFAFIIGAAVGVILLYGPKIAARVSHSASLRVSFMRFTLRSEIPFGPFLIIGFFLVYFFDADLLEIFETVLRL